MVKNSLPTSSDHTKKKTSLKNRSLQFTLLPYDTEVTKNDVARAAVILCMDFLIQRMADWLSELNFLLNHILLRID